MIDLQIITAGSDATDRPALQRGMPAAGRRSSTTPTPRAPALPATDVHAGDLLEVLDLVQDAVLIVRAADQGIVRANAGACRLLGLAEETLRGQPLQNFLVDASPAALAAAAPRSSTPLHACCIGCDGRRIPIRLHIRPGRNGALLMVCRDLRPLRRLAQLARRPAGRDSLTGLPNRAVCRARLQFALSQGQPPLAPFAVLFIDLDRFKQVNDCYGHRGGDAVLSVVARRLTRCLRQDDLLARYGGDEFVAIVENVTTPHEAWRIARRMRRAIERPIRLADGHACVSATIGICWNPPPEQTVDRLVDTADRAMYRAKQSRHGIDCAAPRESRQRTRTA